MTPCDILLVGVGGQGVLTIGDLLLRTAFAADVPASFCPTKGMAQRGGFVKAELRLGVDGVGPRIGHHGADLLVAMERSETLRGIPFVKPGGDVLLYDHVWAPTGVQLGTDDYPPLEEVTAAIEGTGAQWTVLRPSDRPTVDGVPVAANIFLLGALLTRRSLSALLCTEDVEQVLAARWPSAADTNLAAFRAGLSAAGRFASGDEAEGTRHVLG